MVEGKAHTIEEILANSQPGFTDTWQLILVDKDDPNRVTIKELTEDGDLTKPFPLVFSSHPGLGMVRLDNGKLGDEGELIGIGSAKDALKIYAYAKNEADKQTGEIINQFLQECTSQQQLVDFSDQIAEPGYKTTGQVILVNKGDKRALRIADLTPNQDQWEGTLTLASHPGRAIVSAPQSFKNNWIGTGEQCFFGDSSNALKVRITKMGSDNNYYIQQTEGKKFWLEVPRDQHSVGKAMWWRTLHSENDNYFGWNILEDGTIQDCKKANLVLGFGVAKDDEHWGQFSGEHGWDEFKVPSFAQEKVQQKQKNVEVSDVRGPYLRLDGDTRRWMEIPWNDRSKGVPMWFRTKHGSHEHFAFQLNKDGTISPEDVSDLVLGLGFSRRLKDLCLHCGWNESMVKDRERQALIKRVADLENAVQILNKKFEQLEKK